LFCVSSQCLYIPDDLVPRSDMEANSYKIVLDLEEYSRGLLGYFSSLQMERIESFFRTIGETDPWGTVINPLWAVILEKVEDAWRSTGSISRPPSPSSLPQA